jgi:hypothetical protein
MKADINKDIASQDEYGNVTSDNQNGTRMYKGHLIEEQIGCVQVWKEDVLIAKAKSVADAETIIDNL